jgi:putative transposase
VIITDKLKSYGAAKREILPRVEHRQHPRIEQPSGTFAPTHASTRKEHAKVQISPHTHNAFSRLIAPISNRDDTG